MATRVVDLNGEQRKTLRAIKRGAKRNGASPMELKAAVAIGLVEANLGNPSGGDADSGGWRQERRSLYSDVTNLDKSVDRVFREMKGVRGKYGNAGDLAAAVQRPAAQYRGRYKERGDEADALIGEFGRLQATSMAPQPQQTTLPAVPGMGAADDTPERLQAVRMLQSGRSGPLDFALAIRGLDKVKQETQAPLLEERRILSPSTDQTAVPSRGKVAAGGDFKGTQGVIDSLRKIGGAGLSITSAKRQNTNPHSGSRSDHDHGNKDAYANDLSNGSAPTKEMDRAAYRIMRELGFDDYKMGQPINTSRGVKTIKTKEGTFRVQVIYRGSGAAFGGNHMNHVHVGAKRVG